MKKIEMLKFEIFTEEKMIYHTSKYNKDALFNYSQILELKYGKSLIEYWGNSKHIYIVAYEDKKLAGVLKIKLEGQNSLLNPGFCNWVDFISVHPDYQNMGISKKLIEMGFMWLKDNNYDHILISGYSSLGFHFVMNYFKKIAESMGLRFSHEEKIGFPDMDKDGKYIWEDEKHKLLAMEN